MIEVDGVSKIYGQTVAVRDVTLELPEQGVISIIGPNGAGKSTLLAMISRLTPASSGCVRIDGIDVTQAPSDELARRLAILRQDNHIEARLTVRELVEFGRYPYSKGRLTREDRDHIERSMEYLGLQDLSERLLDELSGGQRQRAFVAMVLCQDTKYVLLDEPLNNLDMRHSVGMMRRLRRAADELGKCVIMVLHDINFASCYSDYIVAMHQGRVGFEGSPEEIMQTGVLRSLYGMEIPIDNVNGMRLAKYYDAQLVGD